ncbi:hypothetical protein C1H46_012916 [Malus baccata]|uniref:RING-type E3 ubiquitin transferase n=1 Tax=Malus baccata TaxID=106549 RepID=A0A540MRK8_MALBA|nr:hypothetical protein C1H46_012916 [Malus baccata]
MGWNEATGSGQQAGPSGGEPGPSSSSSDPGVARQFPLAAQPEIMRAAEKDDQYASFVYDACRDAVRHLLGTRVSVAYQNETKLLGQVLYYVLTTGSGQQTLGEEYCDITQVAGPYGLPPMPARRVLFIVYQTALPYIAERISSRAANRGIALADSEELYGISASLSNDAQSSSTIHNSAGSTSGPSVSALRRLKEKFNGLWISLARRWPTVLPIAREFLQLVIRANLMFFYFEGLFYHISKRAAGIRYVFIGKPSNQRPRYQILGVFLLIQLCIIAAEGLRRSNLSSIASSAQQTFGTHQTSAGRDLPVLNEEGNLISADATRGSWVSESSTSEELHHGMVQRKARMPPLPDSHNPFEPSLLVPFRLLAFVRAIAVSHRSRHSVIVSGKLRAARAKSMKFKDGYMISSGQPVNEYIDAAVRHVLLRQLIVSLLSQLQQGVLGIKVKIMLDWDPKGKQGPMTPLPDLVTIHTPKEEQYLPVPPAAIDIEPVPVPVA